MRRFFNLFLALAFFGGALGLGLSTLYRSSVEGAAPAATSAAPSIASEDRGTARSLRTTKRRARSTRRANRRREWAPEIGPVEKVGQFFNTTLGLSRIDISFVDIMSLIFGFMGTVFTYRGYRIQKNRAQAEMQMVRNP